MDMGVDAMGGADMGAELGGDDMGADLGGDDMGADLGAEMPEEEPEEIPANIGRAKR